MPHDGSLRLMSYNVHSCFGTDGVLSLSRIADVIETYRPDVVALQEVDVMRVRTAGENQAQRLAERLRMGFLFSAAHRVGGVKPFPELPVPRLSRLTDAELGEEPASRCGAVHRCGRHSEAWSTSAGRATPGIPSS